MNENIKKKKGDFLPDQAPKTLRTLSSLRVAAGTTFKASGFAETLTENHCPPPKKTVVLCRNHL